jgi:hypothetical protein
MATYRSVDRAKLDRMGNRDEIVITRLAVKTTTDLAACGAMGNDMNQELDAFYLNFDTQEHVSVVWRVTLWMPWTEGHVDVEATTTEEAARLALSKFRKDVEWDDEDYNEDSHHYAEVLDVECENPPVDAILICRGRKTGANLDALFEPDEQPKAKHDKNPDDGGEPCK